MGLLFKRNAEIYISKGTEATADSTNTVQILVSDFSFNRQAIASDVGRVSLAANDLREVRTFIDGVSPVNFSFKTYISPFLDTLTTMPEENLWIGLKGTDDAIPTSTSYFMNFSTGNVRELPYLTIWIYHPGEVDGNYRLNNAVVDSATINFDINGIAEIEWSGRALTLTADNTPPTATDRRSNTQCLKNKISTVSLNMNSVSYDLALVGGSIRIDNNNTFYGRTRLGQTTIPEGHVTGNRTVKGEFELYTKTGTNTSADLLQTLYTQMTTDTYETVYRASITINIGGPTPTNVVLNVPVAILDVTRQNFSELLTMNIGFTAQESFANSITVSYNVGVGVGGGISAFFPDSYFPAGFFPTYFP